jgi:hypothetical protein
VIAFWTLSHRNLVRTLAFSPHPTVFRIHSQRPLQFEFITTTTPPSTPSTMSGWISATKFQEKEAVKERKNNKKMGGEKAIT